MASCTGQTTTRTMKSKMSRLKTRRMKLLRKGKRFSPKSHDQQHPDGNICDSVRESVSEGLRFFSSYEKITFSSMSLLYSYTKNWKMVCILKKLYFLHFQIKMTFWLMFYALFSLILTAIADAGPLTLSIRPFVITVSSFNSYSSSEHLFLKQQNMHSVTFPVPMSF